jgi:hypothetical protein
MKLYIVDQMTTLYFREPKWDLKYLLNS